MYNARIKSVHKTKWSLKTADAQDDFQGEFGKRKTNIYELDSKIEQLASI